MGKREVIQGVTMIYHHGFHPCQLCYIHARMDIYIPKIIVWIFTSYIIQLKCLIFAGLIRYLANFPEDCRMFRVNLDGMLLKFAISIQRCPKIDILQSATSVQTKRIRKCINSSKLFQQLVVQRPVSTCQDRKLNVI